VATKFEQKKRMRKTRGGKEEMQVSGFRGNYTAHQEDPSRAVLQCTPLLKHTLYFFTLLYCYANDAWVSLIQTQSTPRPSDQKTPDPSALGPLLSPPVSVLWWRNLEGWVVVRQKALTITALMKTGAIVCARSAASVFQLLASY
jgi:hypothetical protein